MPARWTILCTVLVSMQQLLLLQYESLCAVSAQYSLAGGDVAALKEIRGWLSDVDEQSASTATFFSTWNFDADPCSFEGVLCDMAGQGQGQGQGQAARVAALNLGIATGSSAGLRGRLHPAMGSLSALVQLTLAPGKVGGRIPATLSRLACLEHLGLSHNLLTGSIPAGLPRLATLDLSFNRLSGAIPADLAALPSLVTLHLAHNRLLGTLPASFEGCPLLDHLDASRNSLLGPLPRLPPSLTHLNLARNRLSGRLRPLESLTRLSFLDLSRNQLCGELPMPLLGSPDLTFLSLHHNSLTGLLCPAQLVVIPTVDLSFNQLSGPLSPFFAFSRDLYLNNNQLTGSVPQEFVDQLVSSSMHTLFLQDNFLTEFPLMPNGSSIPLSASVCVQYNCMEARPPLDSSCSHLPPSRPTAQCKNT